MTEATRGRYGGETIVAAALLIEGEDEPVTMPPPARHHALIRHVCEARGVGRVWVVPPHTLGFLTSRGRFVSRAAAAAMAYEAGQVDEPGGRLLSEDLW